MAKTLDDIRKNAPEIYPEFMQLGRVPPQNLQAEEAVLGAIMLEKDAILKIIKIMQPEMFYSDEHKIIYKACTALFQTSKPIDIVTLNNYLKSTGEIEKIGGAYYLSQLTNSVVSSANIENYAFIILDRFLKRSMIQIGSKIQEMFYDDEIDYFDAYDEILTELYKLQEYTQSLASSGNIDKQIEITITLVQNALMGIKNGITSKFVNVRKVVNSYQKKDFIIWGSRPSMGKTAFALTEAKHTGDGLFFSCEMSAEQLLQRDASQETGIPLAEIIKTSAIEQTELTKEQNNILQAVNAAMVKFKQRNIIIVDDLFTLNEIVARAKLEYLKNPNLKWIMIDFLQTISIKGLAKSTTREKEIEAISRQLKILAKELNTPVIALAQLSREVEKSALKIPNLSHLRDSGSIEQYADLIIFFWRPAYYKIDLATLIGDDNDSPYIGVDINTHAEAIIAKQRQGKAGVSVFLKFIGEQTMFTDTYVPDEIPTPYYNKEPDYPELPSGESDGKNLQPPY